MKTVLLPFLAFVAILALAAGELDPSIPRRVSIAEIEEVRLEVEQPTHKNEAQIRVRDNQAVHKKTLSCDIYYVGEDGREGKIQTITLTQVSPGSGAYSGSSSNRQEFEHGNIVRVVYKSEALRLPITTWHAFYYH